MSNHPIEDEYPWLLGFNVPDRFAIGYGESLVVPLG
jgi:hypoxanthine-guanine phosphoribosyltransferase